MGTVESLAISANSAPHQQAIVDLEIAKTQNKTVVLVIPGGKSLFTETNDKNVDQLTRAIYTWLRRVPSFKECTLKFVKDTSKYKTKEERGQDFPNNARVPIWMIPSKGKTYLARALAEEVIKGGMVSITVKPDGLYLLRELEDKLVPGSDDWEPTLYFTRDRRERYSLN